MEISPVELFRLLYVSLIFGVILGAVQDVHRVIRMSVGLEDPSKRLLTLYEKKIPFLRRPLILPSLKKGRRIAGYILTAFQDIIWFSCAAVGAVVIAYTFNDGRFRAYIFAGMFCGWIGYRLLIGSWFKYLLEMISFVLRAIASVIGFLIFAPLCKIIVFFCKKPYHLLKSFHKTLEKKKKKVYNHCG